MDNSARIFNVISNSSLQGTWRKSYMRIVVGTNTVNSLTSWFTFWFNMPNTYKVDYMKMHEEYDEDNKHDIGLVHVSESIKFDKKVGKITLQTEEFNEEESSAILTGWGDTEVKTLYILKKKETFDEFYKF